MANNIMTNIYREARRIPQSDQDRISTWIAERLRGLRKKKYKILDAGCGDGSLFTIPLLKEFVKNSERLEIFAFDYDREKLSKFGENLKKEEFSCFEDGSKLVKDNITAHLLYLDIERNSLADLKKKVGDGFDLILSTFFIHHLLNWRESLLKLLLLLRKGGLFFIVERTGDICRIDNLWQEKRKGTEWEKFWERYYEIRSEKVFCRDVKEITWYPEISATNLKSLIDVLNEPYFTKEIKGWKFPPKKYPREEVTKWIKKGTFSSSQRWGAKKKRQEIAKEIGKEFKVVKEFDNIEEGLNCYLFEKKCDDNYLKRLFLYSLRAVDLTPILKRPIEEFDRKNDRRRSLQYCESMFNLTQLLAMWGGFSTQTICVVPNVYQLTPNEKWIYERPIFMFRKNFENDNDFWKFQTEYLIFTLAIQKLDISITKLIFEKMGHKPLIYIENITDDVSKESYLKIKEINQRDGQPDVLRIGAYVTAKVRNEVAQQGQIRKLIGNFQKLGLTEDIDSECVMWKWKVMKELFEAKTEGQQISLKEQDIKKVVDKYSYSLKQADLVCLKGVVDVDKVTLDLVQIILLTCIVPSFTHINFVSTEGGYISTSSLTHRTNPISFGGLVVVENLDRVSISNEWDEIFQHERMVFLHNAAQIYYSARGMEETQLRYDRIGKKEEFEEIFGFWGHHIDKNLRITKGIYERLSPFQELNIDVGPVINSLHDQIQRNIGSMSTVRHITPALLSEEFKEATKWNSLQDGVKELYKTLLYRLFFDGQTPEICSLRRIIFNIDEKLDDEVGECVSKQQSLIRRIISSNTIPSEAPIQLSYQIEQSIYIPMEIHTERESRFAYYSPLLLVCIDELLTNALKHSRPINNNNNNKIIPMEIKITRKDNEEMLDITVSNRTKAEKDLLKDLTDERGGMSLHNLWEKKSKPLIGLRSMTYIIEKCGGYIDKTVSNSGNYSGLLEANVTWVDKEKKILEFEANFKFPWWEGESARRNL